jgi:glycosyltransferase involved in cell wall biosynthesis
MRVGLVAYGLDRNPTGVGRYTTELARALAALADGPELVLLTAGGLGSLAGARLRRMPLWGCSLRPGLASVGNAVIPLVARRADLDIVHDPTNTTPFLFGAGQARGVVTVHDVFPWSSPGHSTSLDTLIHHLWLPRVLPKAEAVLTVSEVSKQDIVRYLGVPPTKIHVIYEGVDPAYCPPGPRKVGEVSARYGLPEGYILFVGSVEERKNLRRLLLAYAHLRTRGETRSLVIVGICGRKSVTIVETLEALDLEQHAILTGYVPDDVLPALYSGADLFVFPSLYEGFGLPPLEAMACGTPVVCSNTASLPEVVGDAAVTVDPCDVEALAEAMYCVLTDVALSAELRAKGLERAEQFTWERTARETVAVYREVCG